MPKQRGSLALGLPQKPKKLKFYSFFFGWFQSCSVGASNKTLKEQIPRSFFLIKNQRGTRIFVAVSELLKNSAEALQFPSNQQNGETRGG